MTMKGQRRAALAQRVQERDAGHRGQLDVA
jgi:hypothetical protein